MLTDKVTLISKDSRGIYNDIPILIGVRSFIENLCNNLNNQARKEGSYFSFVVED